MKKRKKLIPQTNSDAITEAKTGSGIASILKYVYIIGFFMLLSGFFHPLISGARFDSVIYGSLVLLLGLAGGILLYTSINVENKKMILLGAGLGLLALSAYLVFLLAGSLN